MSVLAFASVKASPGVTTSVVALAAVWPDDHPVLVVEADPDGGVLAAREGLGVEPGLVTLAVATRRRVESAEVWKHTQKLPGGVPALVGPASAEQARAALAMGEGIARVLGHLRAVDVLVDCGRLVPDAPSLRLAMEADQLFLVARPRLDEIHHLVHAVARLREEIAGMALLLVGERPYPPDEIAAAVGLPVAGVLAEDRRGAAAFSGRGGSGWMVRRSPLVRSARVLAAALTDREKGSPSSAAPTAAPASNDDRTPTRQASPQMSERGEANVEAHR